jgi:glycosyltransferase involved in cell wall biosynthesis
MTSVFFPGDIFRLQHAGGISRYMIELRHELTQMGVDANIELSGSISMMTGDDIRSSSARGGRLNRAARLGLGRVKDLQALAKLPQPTVVHRSYYTKAVFRGRPLVTTVYDLIALLFADEPGDRPTRFLAKNARESDAVIVLSERGKIDLMEQLGIEEGSIHVIPLGVRVPDSNEHQRFNEPSIDQPFILYVGNRGGYKNWSSLVAAFGTHRLADHVRLVSFGGGLPTAEEHELLRSMGLTGSRHEFLGGSDANLDSLYRRATALVFPSKYEGFGLPPLEAMMRRCPVIASTAGSIPEVVGNAAISIDPESPEAIGDAVLSVLESSRRERLIAAGLEQARQFTWRRTAEQTLSVYRSLGA